MKHKIEIRKRWETEDGADPSNPVMLTGLDFKIVGTGESHSIFAPGHNLKQAQIKKAIKDHLRTLPERPELEGITLDVDTEEED